MCLDTVDKEVKKTKGYGWKVFDVSTGKLSPHYQGFIDYYPTEEWIEDTKSGLSDGDYPTGFHVWASKGPPQQIALRLNSFKFLPCLVCERVLFKDVVATGTQNTAFNPMQRQVIVARKMKILEESC